MRLWCSAITTRSSIFYTEVQRCGRYFIVISKSLIYRPVSNTSSPYIHHNSRFFNLQMLLNLEQKSFSSCVWLSSKPDKSDGTSALLQLPSIYVVFYRTFKTCFLINLESRFLVVWLRFPSLSSAVQRQPCVMCVRSYCCQLNNCSSQKVLELAVLPHYIAIRVESN